MPNTNTSEYAEAANKRVRGFAALSGGLLLLLPQFLKNFTPPHPWFILLGLCAAFSALSLIFSTWSILLSERNLRRIASDGKNADWYGYNIAYGLATLTFVAAVLCISGFTIRNSTDFTNVHAGAIDIVLDKAVVGPEEVILIRADVSEEDRNAKFQWTASAGELFDADEKSINWISPPPTEDTQWIEIKVSVSANGLTQTESTRILFISPNNSAPNHSNITLRNLHCLEKRQLTNKRFSHFLYFAQQPDTDSIPPLGSGGLDGLGDLRECCSQSSKTWPLCNPNC